MPQSVSTLTLASFAITYARVQTNIGLHAWVFPTDVAQTQYLFPGSNTRQIVILNTGVNPLLFGTLLVASEASLPASNNPGVAAGVPYGFDVALYTSANGGPIAPVEGNNCTRIPVGASLSIDLASYGERGNFTPVPGPVGTLGYPLALIFFGAVGGDTNADITYINTLGTF
jgi:hypothetical protein